MKTPYSALAVEARNGLPSPATVDDIDDIHTMLFLLYAEDPVKADNPAIARANHVRVAIDRVNNPLALQARLSQQIAAAGMRPLYREIEMPTLVPVLAMTLGGVRVNRSVLESIKHSRQTQMKIARRQLQEIAGRPINPDSAPELVCHLYEDLALPVHAYTPNGNPSTSMAALEPLADQCPAIPVVLRYMEHKSVRDGAVVLLAHAQPSGLVYAELDPLGASTGRFSCSKPNLQGLAAPVRAAVEAQPGFTLLEADVNQCELRVLTHLSQDERLLAAYAGDADVHCETASAVLDIPVDEVTPEQRKRFGKEINFAIVYGMSSEGLAQQIGVPADEAQALLDAHFAAYHGVRRWIDDVHNFVRARGYVHTLYGRRRELPGVRSSDYGDVSRALRQAVNGVVQGTAADLLKLALIRLKETLPAEVHMLLPVHDSVLLEVPETMVEETRQIVAATMEAAPAGFGVPLRVDIHTGRTWADCKQT